MIGMDRSNLSNGPGAVGWDAQDMPAAHLMQAAPLLCNEETGDVVRRATFSEISENPDGRVWVDDEGYCYIAK